MNCSSIQIGLELISNDGIDSVIASSDEHGYSFVYTQLLRMLCIPLHDENKQVAPSFSHSDLIVNSSCKRE